MRLAGVPSSLLLVSALLGTHAFAESGCDAGALAKASLPAPALLACTRTLLADRGDAPSSDALYDSVGAIWLRDTLQPSADDMATLRLVMRELDARHATRPRERRSMVEVLLLNGLVDEAAAYKQQVPSQRAAQYPRVEPLPVAAGTGQARYWRWDWADNVLREQAIDLAHGPRVVVLASAGCHFCAAAATALADDPLLAPVFREHASWIARPDAGFDRDAVRRWDEAHPQAPIRILLDFEGWPRPEVWGTPTFYFLRDGRVLRKVPGWQPDAIESLREGARAIGL